MPQFGLKSLTNLSECHPDLQAIANEAIKHIDFSIIEGHRSKEEQNKAYGQKLSKLKWPRSKHNSQPSMAMDIIPWPFTNWNDVRRFDVLAGHLIAIAKVLKSQGLISHDLRWGGDWDRDSDLADQNFNDLPHFELV